MDLKGVIAGVDRAEQGVNRFNEAQNTIDLRSDDVCHEGLVTNRSSRDHHAASHHPLPGSRPNVGAHLHRRWLVAKFSRGRPDLRLDVLEHQVELTLHVHLQVRQSLPYMGRLTTQGQVVTCRPGASPPYRQRPVGPLEATQRRNVEARRSLPRALLSALYATVFEEFQLATREEVDARPGA